MTTGSSLAEVSPELQPAWRHYEQWSTLCTVGRCAYTDLSGELAAPPWRGRDAPDCCPGYHGVLCVTADAPPVIRVCSCIRKAAWTKRRQAFVREERRKQRDREKAAK